MKNRLKYNFETVTLTNPSRAINMSFERPDLPFAYLIYTLFQKPIDVLEIDGEYMKCWWNDCSRSMNASCRYSYLSENGQILTGNLWVEVAEMDFVRFCKKYNLLYDNE